jgi:hypothetical protein
MKMTLDSGFGLYAKNDEEREFTRQKWEQLNDKDKEFYGNVLPFILMVTKISHVSKTTIPEIIVRLKINRMIAYKKEKDWKEFAEYLERFCGFQANVYMDTFKEFIKGYERDSHFTTKRHCEKARKEMQEYWQNEIKKSKENLVSSEE